MVFTQSNSFRLVSSVIADLPRGPYVEFCVPHFAVYRVISLYANQVDYMFEVPTHKYVDSCDCGHGDVQGVGYHS